MTTKLFDFPLFPPGPHRANDGTVVNLDATGLQELVRNTRFVLAKNLLRPPVGFRHPAQRDFFAKGHVADAQYVNGVAHAFVANPKFIGDAKNGNLLEYSGEIGFVDYTEDGKPYKIGPCIVGIGLLGDERPGIKDPRRKPLEQLVREQAFGESLTPAQTWEIAEELRKTGVVSQTFDGDGRYCFSEITVDPQHFEENTHMPLTAEDLTQIGNLLDGRIKSAVDAAVAPINTTITTMKTDTDAKLKQFSEEARTESKIVETLDTIRKERHLGKIPMERLEKALREPTFDNVRAFAEVAPTAAVPLGEQHGDDPGAGQEPAAIAKLRVSDFDEPSKNDARLAAGMKAFAEDPQYAAQYAIVREKPYADRTDALKTIIAQRDARTN